jgi:hypothetical protein
MVPVSFAVHPVLVVLFWLTFGAWVALWLGIVQRDRGTDVHTPSDQGSRALIGITLWSGVLGAFLLAWTVPATQLPGSGWPVLGTLVPDGSSDPGPPSPHRRGTVSLPTPPVLCRFSAHPGWPGSGPGKRAESARGRARRPGRFHPGGYASKRPPCRHASATPTPRIPGAPGAWCPLSGRGALALLTRVVLGCPGHTHSGTAPARGETCAQPGQTIRRRAPRQGAVAWR